MHAQPGHKRAAYASTHYVSRFSRCLVSGGHRSLCRGDTREYRALCLSLLLYYERNRAMTLLITCIEDNTQIISDLLLDYLPAHSELYRPVILNLLDLRSPQVSLSKCSRNKGCPLPRRVSVQLCILYYYGNHQRKFWFFLDLSCAIGPTVKPHERGAFHPLRIADLGQTTYKVERYDDCELWIWKDVKGSSRDLYYGSVL
jgi:hypothetical protein